MGLDIQNIRLLSHCHQYGDFKDTLTIGRQAICVNEEQLKYLLEDDSLTGIQCGESYCEDIFINNYGSTKVDSIDYSDYEKCTIIHDMNNPILDNFQKYDTIFDGGSLEHIFNINQALKNVSLLCKPGGQIIHSLPANNQCGHGFWQFSPELFLSLYSEKNGYLNTEVYIASVHRHDDITRIEPHNSNGRIEINIEGPSYVWVRTVLGYKSFNHENIQQIDYEINYWNKNN
jgi:SAM-dependent methyltransferase